MEGEAESPGWKSDPQRPRSVRPPWLARATPGHPESRIARRGRDFSREHKNDRRPEGPSAPKVWRAHGGCLGAGSRRRARQAAIVPGEPHTGLDPGVPEWGNPAGEGLLPTLWEATGGTETSKYPEERKSRRDPPSSGERTGASPNRGARKACGRCRPGVEDAASGPRTARPQSQSTCPAEDAWEGARHRVRAPYAKARACGPQSGVPPGTRNPAGSRGDRPPRLSTTLRPTVHEYREGKVKSTPGGE